MPKRKKRARKSHLAKNLPINQIVNIIREDVLAGISSETIATNCNLKLNDVNRAVKIIETLYMERSRNMKEASVEETTITDDSKEPDENTSKIEQVEEETKIEKSPIENAFDEYKKGGKSQLEIAKNYNISYYTFNKYCKANLSEEEIINLKNRNLKTSINKNKKEKKDEVDEVVVINEVKEEPIASSLPDEYISIDNLSMIDKKDESVIECGLVKNRHNMNVQKFIYNNISENQMFDFRYMEDTCINFIKDNIVFDENGIPDKSLKVRCTGLQTALSTLIKVCYDNKINLSLSHYQFSSSKCFYREQKIFSDFESKESIPYIIQFLNKYAKGLLYLYKSSPSDYKDIKEFYEMHISCKDKNVRNGKLNSNSDKIIHEFIIICKDKNDFIELDSEFNKQYTFNHDYYRSIVYKMYTENDRAGINYDTEVIKRSYY